MNKYIKNTVIPNELILNYKKYNLSENNLITLLQIKTFDDEKVNLIYFLELTNISKIKIEDLLNKDIISLEEDNGNIYIYLYPLYEKIYGKTNKDIEKKKNDNLSIEELDKIKYMLNQELKPFELEKIKHWKKSGFTFEEIESAIYKALVKNIKNLNYIETILFNEIPDNTKEDNNIENKIIRNWSFE